jgi:hypothetical protein|tara:strand:+ start:76 stop:333 length:258 start_codon:yes stop_codon:yes gene_type:complete
MRVRVAFKKNKRIHERDMWIITVYDTPTDIIRYDKRATNAMQKKIFSKKAKNKELIIREILEVVELTHSNLTIDEHKSQNNKEMS